MTVIGVLLLIKFMSPERKKVPPNPPGIPLLGNINTLRKETMLSTMRKLHKQYGDLFSINIINQRLIFVGGYKTTYELLVKKGDVLGDRPNFLTKQLLRNAGVFSTSGPLWKEHRTFCLTSLRSLGFNKGNLQTRIIEEIEYFLAEVENTHGQPFDIQDLVSKSIANVISALVFGKRFELSDPTSAELCLLLNAIFQSTVFHSPIFIFPFLKHLPGDLFGSKKLMKKVNQIFDIICKILDEHRSTFDENNIRDFIDCYLKEQKKKNEAYKEHTFSDEQLLSTLVEFFSAGLETTSTAIKWGIVYLMHNQEIQKRMRKEIENTIASGRLPTLEDKPKLPYCQAVCYEVLRLGNVSPTTSPHALKHDVTLNGFVIPKEAFLFIDLDSINMDPKIFPDPFSFKPERFLSEDGKVTGTEKICAFSMGRRVCLGESVAKMELFLFMTSLIQRFEIHNEAGKLLPSLKGNFGLTYTPQSLAASYKKIF
uniref:Cytochrome P450 2E1-like n=1 Tax=Crassostrea virginica TaxID=6565 RepID=A0A8B8BI78_CRAVI|nr:cytochrome P450 2E1-like [Crassostrea virginica]